MLSITTHHRLPPTIHYPLSTDYHPPLTVICPSPATRQVRLWRSYRVLYDRWLCDRMWRQWWQKGPRTRVDHRGDLPDWPTPHALHFVDKNQRLRNRCVSNSRGPISWRYGFGLEPSPAEIFCEKCDADLGKSCWNDDWDDENRWFWSETRWRKRVHKKITRGAAIRSSGAELWCRLVPNFLVCTSVWPFRNQNSCCGQLLWHHLDRFLLGRHVKQSFGSATGQSSWQILTKLLFISHNKMQILKNQENEGCS